MAVNFGQFDGYKITAEAGSRAVDRLVNAVQEKKRQEEEKKRLELEQDRFEASKQQFDARLEFEKGASDRDYELKKKDFISDEIARYEETTGYTGQARYDDEGNFIGVTSPVVDGELIPTFARSSFQAEMDYKGDALDKEYDFKDKQLTQQGNQFKESLSLDKQRLFLGIQQQILDRVQKGEMFDKEMTFKELQLSQQEEQFLKNYGLDAAKVADYLDSSELDRQIKEFGLSEEKKKSQVKENVKNAKTLMTSNNLRELSELTDTGINSLLDAAGLNELSDVGIKQFRDSIEDQKTRNIKSMEDNYKLTGKIDMDAYSNAYFDKFNEVPSDLKEKLIKKTGGEGATLLKYGMDESDKLWADTTTKASKGNWTKEEEIGAGGQDFQFKGKNINDKDNMLVGAMRNKLVQLTGINDGIDDMFLEKKGPNSYVLTEDDPVYNDEIKIKMGPNGPQALIGSKYVDLDEEGLELVANKFGS